MSTKATKVTKEQKQYIMDCLRNILHKEVTEVRTQLHRHVPDRLPTMTFGELVQKIKSGEIVVNPGFEHHPTPYLPQLVDVKHLPDATTNHQVETDCTAISAFGNKELNRIEGMLVFGQSLNITFDDHKRILNEFTELLQSKINETFPLKK